MLFAFALPIIEKTLNRYLQLDSESKRRLLAMTGKAVAIELSQSGKKIYFVVDGSYVQLFDRYDGVVDVILRGTPFDFLRLGAIENSGAAIFSSDITVTGNPEVAQQFKRIFAELEIDWEDQLSRVTGDVIAYQVGSMVRSFCGWAKQTSNTMQQNLTEYIQEEARLLPSSFELEDFYAEVDQARDAVERLALRIARLDRAA